jgi:hypothetical protein
MTCPVTNIRNTNLASLAPLAQTGKPLLGPRTAEPNPETGKKDVVWFARNDERPLFAFGAIAASRVGR